MRIVLEDPSVGGSQACSPHVGVPLHPRRLGRTSEQANNVWYPLATWRCRTPTFAVDLHEGKEGEEMDSKDFARWAPGMMREIARALTLPVQGKTLAICKLTWANHIDNSHVTLALDTAGTFCVGEKYGQQEEAVPAVWCVQIAYAGRCRGGRPPKKKICKTRVKLQHFRFKHHLGDGPSAGNFKKLRKDIPI